MCCPGSWCDGARPACPGGAPAKAPAPLSPAPASDAGPAWPFRGGTNPLPAPGGHGKMKPDAGVVEWVDAGDSKSPGARPCASSSLASGTREKRGPPAGPFFAASQPLTWVSPGAGMTASRCSPCSPRGFRASCVYKESDRGNPAWVTGSGEGSNQDPQPGCGPETCRVSAVPCGKDNNGAGKEKPAAGAGSPSA